MTRTLTYVAPDGMICLTDEGMEVLSKAVDVKVREMVIRLEHEQPDHPILQTDRSDVSFVRRVRRALMGPDGP